MSKQLTPNQIQAYHRDGLLFPLPALTPREVIHFRSMHDQLDRNLGDKPTIGQKSGLHVFYKWACDLVTHPRILDTVEDIIGPDILVHSSTIFSKYPGDQNFVSWHQDTHYLGLSKDDYVSVWIALTDSNPNNGCLRLVPGTHLRKYDHFEAPHEHNLLDRGQTVLEKLDTSTAVDIELQAGEMSFHHANIVHGSKPNTTSSPRIGFAVRYVATSVKQTANYYPVVMLARGQDHYHHYTLQEKPTAGPVEGLLAHQSFLKAYE